MTKRQAKKIKLGDTVLKKHHPMSHMTTVIGVINHHEDPKAKVPLFRLANGDLMTYLLLNHIEKMEWSKMSRYRVTFTVQKVIEAEDSEKAVEKAEAELEDLDFNVTLENDEEL